jgi:hypothetical protein
LLLWPLPDAPNPSQAVDIHDLAIIGEVTERDDHKPLAGIGGALGGGSRIRDLLDPAVLTCGAFLLDWKGSNSGFSSTSAHGC